MSTEPEIGAKVPHPWSRGPDAQEAIYIGSEHMLSPFVQQGEETVIGYAVWHHCQEGRWAAGGVYFDIPQLPARIREDGRSTWTLVSSNPLHVEPSILCRACGDHGFIRNGRWEAA